MLLYYNVIIPLMYSIIEEMYMLSRIQEIKNIGTFLNSHPASIELSNLVLMYGSNSQGKTTICDVFKSLKNNDPVYITQRKTVGQVDQPTVSFNFSNGKNARFQRGSWCIDPRLGDMSNIEIFDTTFVFDNVFTNNAIEHKNKENFTRFIIGEKSIKLSKELMELNEQKNALAHSRDSVIADIESEIKSIMSLEDFIKVPYQIDIHNEDVALLGIKSTINDETKNLESISDIKKLKFPTTLPSIDISILIEINNINQILTSSYSFQKQDLIELYNKHKKTYINSSNTSEIDNWILQGTQWIIDQHCPFCGSSLAENESIDVFMEFFSKEIRDYTQKVLSLNKTKFPTKLDVNPTKIIQNEDLAKAINEKVFDEKVANLYHSLLGIRENLISDYEDCEKELKLLVEDLDKKKQNKLEDIYSSVEVADLQGVQNSIEKYNNNIKTYNTMLQEFNISAGSYIASLTADSINSHIKELNNEYNRLLIIVKRNLLNKKIQELESLKEQIKQKSNLSKQKKQDFDREQESYLTEFYDDINAYFIKFGSRNYEIKKAISTKGTNKTYSLDIYFRNELVPKEKIQFVLSESDRRALALSIFFTKIKRTATSETIIFLDDPITSFDVDRMNDFINEVKKIRESVAQLIITTHYQNFYKKAVELTKDEQPTLIKITHGTTTNNLEKIEPKNETMLMDEYQAAIYKMVAFMEGSSHSYSEVDARTILQKHLEYHFAYKIKKENFNYTQLHELLNWLRDKGCLSSELFKELDLKREEYNSPAHQFDNDEEEQKRNSIFNLYSILQKV